MLRLGYVHSSPLTVYHRSLLLVLIVLLVVFGCERKNPPPPKIGDLAPPFTLKDLDGKKVSLDDFKEKVVLIDFWATWCPPCKESVPDLDGLYRKYKDNGIIILGLSVDAGGPQIVKAFKEAYKMSYPILMADESITRKYGVRGIPSLFILDKDGRIQQNFVGFSPGMTAMIEKKIKELL